MNYQTFNEKRYTLRGYGCGIYSERFFFENKKLRRVLSWLRSKPASCFKRRWHFLVLRNCFNKAFTPTHAPYLPPVGNVVIGKNQPLKIRNRDRAKYIKIRKINYCCLVILLVDLAGCTPMIHPSGAPVSSCQIVENMFVTSDGVELPLKKWQPVQPEIKAVIIAVHGFNDYSHFFQQPGNYFKHYNTISYAYDQRGFGGSPNRGLWAGVDTYIDDLACFIQLIKNQHPKAPIYLLGESMGGAIIITTMAQTQIQVDGIILSAPAVWARQTMPWYQNVLLWTLSHTVPWMTLTGEDLGITPSDNIEMLRAMGRDPLVIKETRVESIYGMVNLMDQALADADLISTNTLLLYGEKDEIIPKEPTFQFLNNLIDNQVKHPMIAFYKNGYHMLLRDLQASVVWRDIDVWINSSSRSLPSEADTRAQQLLDRYILENPINTN